MIDAKTRRQVVRFVIAGVLATLSDALVYFTLLHTALPGRHDASKAASFVVGTVVAFVLAKYFTFEQRERNHGQAVQFVALYGTAFLVNVGMNRASLWALAVGGVSLSLAEPVAFVIATGCSTVLNFLGQKLWVFRGA